MRSPLVIGHAGLVVATAALLPCLIASAGAQAAPGQATPLGDIARKARRERSSKDHATAKLVSNEETDPTTNWTVHACTLQPCFSLTITLPKGTERSRALSGPSYTLIPLRGHEADPSHAIRIYAADLLQAGDLPQAKRLFLQEWFSRPYYFGQAARFVLDEHLRIEGYPATLTRFTVANSVIKYRGISLIAQVPTGTFGFACVFHDEDSGDATSVCESVLNSVSMEVPEQYRPRVQSPPEESDPPSDDPPDPADATPEDDPQLR